MCAMQSSLHVCSANLVWMKRFLQGACVLGFLFMFLCWELKIHCLAPFSTHFEWRYCTQLWEDQQSYFSSPASGFLWFPGRKAPQRLPRGLHQTRDVAERWMMNEVWSSVSRWSRLRLCFFLSVGVLWLPNACTGEGIWNILSLASCCDRWYYWVMRP